MSSFRTVSGRDAAPEAPWTGLCRVLNEDTAPRWLSRQIARGSQSEANVVQSRELSLPQVGGFQRKWNSSGWLVSPPGDIAVVRGTIKI